MTELFTPGLDWINQYSRHGALPRSLVNYTPSQAILAGALHALFRRDVIAFSAINHIHNISYFQYYHVRSWLKDNFRFSEEVLNKCMTTLAWLVVKTRLTTQSPLVAAVSELDDRGIFVQSVVLRLKEAWGLPNMAVQEPEVGAKSNKTRMLKVRFQENPEIIEIESRQDSEATPDLPESTTVQDPDAKDGAIHKAAMDGRLDDVVALLEDGAAVDCRGERGHTPLQYAAKYGRLEVARKLIRSGADLDLGNDWAWTPLHHAAHYCRYAIAELLIEAGADTRVVDTVYGKTPFGWIGYNLRMAKLFKSKGVYS